MTTSHTKSNFWKTAIKYGFPAGALIIGFMVVNFALFGLHSDASSQLAGFTIMFFILSLIFFGMKKYRDAEQGGVIKFGRAFLLGLAMSAFAGIAYIIGWEIYLAITDSNFITAYTDHLIENQKAKGLSGAELQTFIDKMAAMVESYQNPFYRIPITFTEIFPMGLIVSMISALILHRPKFWARKA